MCYTLFRKQEYVVTFNTMSYLTDKAKSLLPTAKVLYAFIIGLVSASATAYVYVENRGATRATVEMTNERFKETTTNSFKDQEAKLKQIYTDNNTQDARLHVLEKDILVIKNNVEWTNKMLEQQAKSIDRIGDKIDKINK